MKSAISLVALACAIAVAGCDSADDPVDNEAVISDNGTMMNEEMASDASAPVTTSELAMARLMTADGDARGSGSVSRTDQGIEVRIAASGMRPGRYGVHLHQTGKCDGPKFESAGAHWNPSNAQHGFDNPKGSHRGDLPNLVVDAGQTGEVRYTITDLPDAGDSDGSENRPSGSVRNLASGLLEGDGTAIVIHAEPDDLLTDPSGNSGDRIACGVLRAPARQ